MSERINSAKKILPLRLISLVPKPIRYGVAGGLISSVAWAASSEDSLNEQSVHIVGIRTDNPQSEIDDLFEGQVFELPCKDSEFQPCYFTGGPHWDNTSRGVRYAIDIATDRVVHCPGSTVLDRFVSPIAGGTVITAGAKNRSNRDYSIVKIRLDNGLIVGYEHLDNIRVHIDQRVEIDDVLGNPSCKTPSGGEAEGAHVHLFVLNKDGYPIPIEGIELSGWKVHASRGNYQGTMTKWVLDRRTADRRRCGPSQVSMDSCGGIRNDLTSVEVLEDLPGDSSQPTPQEIMLSKEQEAVEKAEQFVAYLKQGNVSAAFNMETPQNLRDTRKANYTALPTLEQLKQCSDQMRYGQFQDESFSIIRHPSRQISEPYKDQLFRDIYSVGAGFTYSDWNYQAGQRGNPKNYGPVDGQTDIWLEDVNGVLYINRAPLCLFQPLGTVVNQPLDR